MKTEDEIKRRIQDLEQMNERERAFLNEHYTVRWHEATLRVEGFIGGLKWVLESEDAQSRK
ncbi:MAG: hypothetical protein ACLQU1_33570 [Bryobacteraceae bacterium]